MTQELASFMDLLNLYGEDIEKFLLPDTRHGMLDFLFRLMNRGGYTILSEYLGAGLYTEFHGDLEFYLAKRNEICLILDAYKLAAEFTVDHHFHLAARFGRYLLDCFIKLRTGQTIRISEWIPENQPIDPATGLPGQKRIIDMEESSERLNYLCKFMRLGITQLLLDEHEQDAYDNMIVYCLDQKYDANGIVREGMETKTLTDLISGIFKDKDEDAIFAIFGYDTRTQKIDDIRNNLAQLLEHCGFWATYAVSGEWTVIPLWELYQLPEQNRPTLSPYQLALMAGMQQYWYNKEHMNEVPELNQLLGAAYQLMFK